MRTGGNQHMRIGITAIGTAVLGNAVIATLYSNLHAGIWFTYALGVILLLWGILLPRLPRAIHCLLTAGVATATACVCCLFLYGRVDSVNYDEDAVIVLGSGIRGTRLGKDLQNRLDRAVEYYAMNPDVIIAVSGGQGPQEDIPEGVAMEQYLLEQGIPQSHILRETASSSTGENFRYTKPLLDAHFAGDYRIAYITSDYHIFRAGVVAARAGFDVATHACAPTPWYMLIPNGLRECAAIVKYWLNLSA